VGGKESFLTHDDPHRNKSISKLSKMLPENPVPDAAASYDFILIGAGGAGMCLLLALHERGGLSGKRVLVLEPERKDANDRTWCFWAKDSDPIAQSLGALASHRWDFAWVGGAQQALSPYRYYHLRSADFYAHVKNAMRQYPLVEWRQAAAEEVIEAEDVVWVQASGQRFSADRVFDSRLGPQQIQQLQQGDETIWQSFVGWRVHLTAPLSEPQAIRLMDFDIAQDGAAQFVYLLPTASDEALVEVTRFGKAPIAGARAEQLLASWIGEYLGSYEILESEAGCIPMSQCLNPAAPQHPAAARVIPIGTAAGAVKASTGYALERMYRHACGIAAALENQAPLPTPYSKPRFAFYDRLLLWLLAHRPELGKPIFEQLFRRVPLPRVLAFLDEKSSLPQEIPLLLSLPIPPFLLALGRAGWAPARPTARPEALSSQGAAITLAVAALALVLQYLVPGLLQALAPPVLLLGMVFPGIPHGALDHCLSPAGQLQGLALLRFIAFYVAIMGGILLVWLLSPPLALLAFLLYSAWHFGETDLRHWGAFRPARAWLHGAAALGFILAAHPAEFEAYLQALGLGAHRSFPPLLLKGVAAASLAGLLGTGFFIPSRAWVSWLQTLLVLLAGAFLPLLLAFGLYFIGVHSLSGWRHLQAGLKVPHAALLRQSLPFSLGAFALFALLLAVSYLAELPFEGMIPGLFVFLAAISAPHIWFMHVFYDERLP
jgi:lycopene beta-cyclase